MYLILSFFLFFQVGVADQIATVISDANSPDQLDLLFADGTVWGTSQVEPCDWLTPGILIDWEPANHGVALLEPVPTDGTRQCWVNTFEIDNP